MPSTGSGCFQSEWPSHNQEETEGDEESTREDGETAGKAWERGQTQRTAASQHWLCVLMIFSASPFPLLFVFVLDTLHWQTVTTHMSHSRGVAMSVYGLYIVNNSQTVDTNEAAYEIILYSFHFSLCSTNMSRNILFIYRLYPSVGMLPSL